MADNRTTVKSNIQTLNVPSVTNAELNTMLRTYLSDNLKFLEDDARYQLSSATIINCDFTGKDRIDLERKAGPLQIHVAGIADGEEVFLLITKTAGNSISWVGVTDITPVKAYVTASSLILYSIVNKGGNYFSWAWIESVKQATISIPGIALIANQAEHDALSSTNKFCVPGYLPTPSTTQRGLYETATTSEIDAGSDSNGSGHKLTVVPSQLARRLGEVFESNSWANASLDVGWSGTLRYFLDNYGFLHLHAQDLTRTGSLSLGSQDLISALSGVGPVFGEASFIIRSRNTSTGGRYIHDLITGAGIGLQLMAAPNAYTAGDRIDFYVIFRRDS